MDFKHLAKCSECPLNGSPCLLGRGPPSAKLAIVSERPSTTDMDAGEIMHSPYWLKKAIGPRVNQTWRTPAIACRPYRKISKRDLDKAVECCRPRVEAELKTVGASCILAAGKYGFQSAYGKRKNVEEWFGAVAQWPADKSVHLIATMSPPWYYSPNMIPMFMRFAQRAWRFSVGSEQRHRWPSIIVEPSAEAVDALRHILSTPGPVGYDLETIGTDSTRTPITAVGLANADVAVSLPWDAYDTRTWGKVHALLDYERGAQLDALVRQILVSPAHVKVMHNAQADLIPMAMRGIAIGNWDDTLGLHRTLSPDILHDLQFAAACEIAVPPWKALFCAGGDSGAVGTYVRRDPVTELRPYNARDSAIEVPLYGRLLAQVEQDAVLRTHMDEYRRLVPIAAKMKMHGLRISRQVYERHRQELTDTADQLRLEFQQHLQDYNLPADAYSLGATGTNTGLQKLFFDELACPVVSTTEEGEPALNSAALGTYLKEGDARQKAFSKTTLAYRKVKKLETSFYNYKNLHAMPDGDLRANPNSNPLGTQGSRWTMSAPNAQQFTKGTFIAGRRITPNIRECIIPDPGFVLVEADHSQQELRLIAYVMDVAKLIDWFAEGKDVHKMHAARLLQKDESTINKRERNFGKKVFGFNYAISDDVTAVYESMKADFPDVTMSYVKAVRASYMELHPNIPLGQKRLIQEAKDTHRIVCRISGRFRHFYAGRVDQNQVLNFPMQTGGGSIMNRAMLMLDPHIRWGTGEAILLNCHDALVVQCRLERVPEIFRLLKWAMGVPVDIGKHRGVSIPVDCSMGPSWGAQSHFRGVHVELPELAALLGVPAHSLLDPETQTHAENAQAH